MYISANGDALKYPVKIFVDGESVTIGEDEYFVRQLGTGNYLMDNKWHHWYIELSKYDTTEKITWFSRNTSGILVENYTDWEEKQLYLPDDWMSGSENGQVMATYGDYLVIGMFGRDIYEGTTRTKTDIGIVRILKKQNNVWSKIKDISSNPSEEQHRRFGFSLSMYGDYLVVGDYDDNSDIGAIYIYNKDEGGTDNWEK